VRILSKRTLRLYAEGRKGHHDHRALCAALDSWYHEVHAADWTKMADVKEQFATASVISSDRIVFNIKGNSHRLVVAVDFEKSVVFVKWIGTHNEYDDIDVKAIQYGD
jgi:mRNA interferase HigB